jgi:hypothetical protein
VPLKTQVKPTAVLYDMRKSVSGILEKPFTKKIDHQIFRPDQKVLALWAADCAEHVLPYFEGKYPEDDRPRKAIQVLRDWIRSGIFSMKVVREASLAAHTAAKGKKEMDAVFAAHAAGQALGTAHVPTHALGSSVYAIRAVIAHSGNPGDSLAKERTWQLQCLQKYAERDKLRYLHSRKSVHPRKRS